MGSRINLHKELVELVPNVYFQPPSSVQLKYPCIVYKLEAPDVKHADDKAHVGYKQYSITHIFKDADGDLIKAILGRFSYSSYDRRYVSDNLYHDTYRLFY